jgi:hypothetical protein
MWRSNTWYETAVYWPNDDAYGTAARSDTEEKARAMIPEWEKMGYNVPGKSEVHLRKVTLERIV